MKKDLEIFDKYHLGQIVNLTWYRGNIKMQTADDYVYLGKRDGVPVLKHYCSLEGLSNPEQVKQIPSLDVLEISVTSVKESGKSSLPEHLIGPFCRWLRENN